MIIGVSIVDKHKPDGERHVGTFMFEIDYPGDSHFDFMTMAAASPDEEAALRPFLNRLMRKEDMMAMPGGAVDANGDSI